MTTLYVVIPLALLVSGAAVIAFVWSVRQGQMDDLETPAWRVLEEDESGTPSARKDENEPSASPGKPGRRDQG